MKASLFLFLLMLWADLSHGQLCRKWGEIKQLGSLPVLKVREASGLCLSTSQKERAYWVNDSGNKTEIHVGNLNGENFQSVALEGFKAADTEALVCARCQDGPCLILADIGDNRRRRKIIKLAFIQEQESWPEQVQPFKSLELTYPDGPHDAEAMFVAPNGDLVIITKEFQWLPPKASAAKVYSIDKQTWQAKGNGKARLKLLGELPLPLWAQDLGPMGQVVTDASYNEKRGILGLLTYTGLIEIKVDKLKDVRASASWQSEKDFSLVPLKPLAQQETLGYTADDTVIWSTEYFPPQAPIFSMTCQERGS